MRTRLDKNRRRADILETARRLFAERGFAGTEMENIRRAAGLSRGGLYHHFGNRRAVLNALVDAEVAALAEMLGAEAGVLAALGSEEERMDYLSALEDAFARHLRPALTARLEDGVRAGTEPGHVAELFLTVASHINRREILGHWNPGEAARFAATALDALAPLLADPAALAPLVAALRERGVRP